DLSNADLREADLQGALLGKTKFEGTNMSGGDPNKANGEGVHREIHV
ncbi:MAG: pentapeptide repeat-containing protein, partial [Ktedonobacteraceae bacterium]|nr:pentapeptide repeat-containing protein [Ktedonobacteraceae bacterium]